MIVEKVVLHMFASLYTTVTPPIYWSELATLRMFVTGSSCSPFEHSFPV